MSTFANYVIDDKGFVSIHFHTAYTLLTSVIVSFTWSV